MSFAGRCVSLVGCCALAAVAWLVLMVERSLLFVVNVLFVVCRALCVARSMLCLGRCALWVVSRLLLVDCCLLFAVC